MDVSETDLPGVGKKHEIPLKSGAQAIVLTHNSGKRELMRRQNADADPERLLELTDKESRVLGTVLEGAYFQPVGTGDDETMFADNMILDWLTVTDTSPIVGSDVSAAVPEDVTVVAIYRDGHVVTGSPPATTFQSGDTVIVVGERDAVGAFETQVAGDT